MDPSPSSLRPVRRVDALALVLAILMTLPGCIGGTANVQLVRAQTAVTAPLDVDHGAFDRVLTTYVDDVGRVDYAALKADAETDLVPYLQQLGATDPSNLSEAEQLAFWINAYNAYTLKLIVDHYPVETINAIKPGFGPQVPKVNSPFQLDVGDVAGAVRSLDEIEHGIIRERFDEPRIHFALVCAAVSCPPLRREAYTGDRLDAQLDDQARIFLRDADKNQIPVTADRIAVTKLFKWFEKDFGGTKASVQRFIAPYFDGAVGDALSNAAYDVEYVDYDWSLNVQP